MTNRRITDTTTSLDTYLELVELTEPPLLYHRWAFISIISAALGRNIWLEFGDSKIYANQFITLIGPPGARKSTAINIATDMLADSGYEFFSGDSSSKEKFLMDWAHGFDKISKGIEAGDSSAQIDEVSSLLMENGHDSDEVAQAYINAGELEDFLGGGNAGFVTTLTNLWDNKDKYTTRFKNSKSIYLSNPTVNLLGGATTATFASIFNANIIGKGMLSRMILVHGKGQRMRLTIPPPLPKDLRTTIVELLHGIRTGLRGPVSLTSGAYEAIDGIYKGYADLEDARLASYSSRRLTHMLKLCLVIVASELETEITTDMVILANSILSYTEALMPKALGEFGKSRNSEVTQIILEAISSTKQEGVSLTELLVKVSQDIDSIHDLSTIAMKLTESGKVEVFANAGVHKFRIKKRQINNSNEFINYKLLYEFRFREADEHE